MQAEVALMTCNAELKWAVYCTRSPWWQSRVVHRLQKAQEVIARDFTIKESPESSK